MIGKAPTLAGKHKGWPEWSFQFKAHAGSANPESIEALRWAVMEENPIKAAAVRTQGFQDDTQPSAELCLRTVV